MKSIFKSGFFNYDFYRNIKHHKLSEGLTREEKRKIKHNDFWVYDAKFRHHLDFDESDFQPLSDRANEINIPEITPEDIRAVTQIMNSEILSNSVKEKRYLFYSEKRLDDLMSEMIESFTNDYLED